MMKKLLSLVLCFGLLFALSAVRAETVPTPKGLSGCWSGIGTNKNAEGYTVEILFEKDGTGTFIMDAKGNVTEYPLTFDGSGDRFILDVEKAGGDVTSAYGTYTLADGVMHVVYNGSMKINTGGFSGSFNFSYEFDCTKAGLQPDVEWMGRLLRVDEIRESVDKDTPFGMKPAKGRYVVAKVLDTGDGIPEEEIVEANLAGFVLADASGNSGTLVSWSQWGVGFNAETGMFSTNPVQEGFELIFDVPADADLAGFTLVYGV